MFWSWILATIFAFYGASTSFAQSGFECPGDVYFFVNKTADLSREVYAKVTADSLESCIKLCYSWQFCFSAIYRPENTDQECTFSYHSAYNCTRKELVTSYNHTGNYSVVECLKCPDLGDLIDPPFTPDYGNELTAITTAAPVVLEETTTDLQVLGQEDENATTVQVAETTPATTQANTTAASTAAATTAAQAQTTTQANATEANTTLVAPVTTAAAATTVATTEANTTLAATTEANTTVAATTEAPTTAANTTAATTTENVTAAEVIEATVISVTKGDVESIDTSGGECSGTVKSGWNTTNLEKSTNFSSHEVVETAQGCAETCYKQGCTRAGYEPDTGTGSGGACLMSFDQDDAENCTAVASDRESLSNLNITSTISIYCTACYANDTTTVALAEATTLAATTADLSTTAAPTTTQSDTSSCDANFLVIEPSSSKQLGSIDAQVSASSAQECAVACFQNNCTAAGYQPPAEGSNLATEGICLLSYEDSSDLSDCVDVERVQEYETTQPVLILCVTCASLKLSLNSQKIEKVEKTVIDFRLERPEHHISTSSPLFSQVNCYSCISNEPCDTGSCRGTYCVVQAQRNDILGITVISHTCGVGRAISIRSGCHLSTVQPQTTLTCVCADDYCNNGEKIADFLLSHPKTTLSQILALTTRAEPEKTTTKNIAKTTMPQTTTAATTTSSRAEESTTTELKTCAEKVVFQVSSNPKFNEETDRLQSIWKIVLADSVAECAEICYKTGCTEARYTPSSKGCFLSRDNDRDVSNSCDESSVTFVDSYTTFKSVHLRCVKCGQPTAAAAVEKSSEKESVVEVVTECDLTFESTVQPVAVHVVFKNSTLVNSVAECAKKCHQQSCQLAEYAPALVSQGSSMAYCYLYSSKEELCDESASRMSSNDQYGRVLVKCVRCEYATTTSAAPEQKEKTTTESIAQIELKVWQERHEADKIPDVEYIPKSPAASLDSSPEACVITFETSSAVQEILDGTIRFKNSTTTRSAAECAQACYQSGCVGAGYDPQVGSCLMAYGISEHCANTDRTAVYGGNEQVVLQCLRCDINYDGPREVGSVITKRPFVQGAAAVKIREKSMVQSVKAKGGCVVTFEVAEIDITAGLTFKNGTNEPRTAGACAHRCYRDGCTLAGWDPLSRYCFFYYGDTEHCANTRRYLNYNPSYPVWLQCLRCGTSNPRDDDDIEAIATTENVPPETSPELTTTEVSTTASVPQETSSETTTEAPTTTTVESTTAAQTTDLTSTTGAKSETTTLEATTLGAAFVQAELGTTKLESAPELSTELETTTLKHGSTVDVTDEPNAKGSSVKPCSGDLTFELSVIRFINDFRYDEQRRSRSVAECAETCFEVACTTAGYIPSNGICLLSFVQEACFSAAKRYSSYTGSEVVRIDCIRCENQEVKISLDNEVVETQRLDIKPQTIRFDHLKPRKSSVDTGILKQIRSGTSCSGRLVFQALIVASLPKLNVTNDIFAKSPSDCAEKCWEMQCTMAGFIPNPAQDGGVCLLSRDPGMCKPDVPLVPQYGDSRPFVISCIACSACNYSVGLAVPTSVLPALNVQTDAASVTECAVRCSEVNCTAAAYSNRAPAGNCLLSTEGREQCSLEDQLELNSQESLPLKLDCVRCDL